jgi:LuxR family quorum sensing-dependent transcriptional regulator
MGDGLCVPIHDVNGFQAVVSMAGPRLEISPHQHRALHLLSYYAHDAAARISRRRRQRGGVRLSTRERDVLSWFARGKRTGEVAQTLGVASDTVRTHLDRAKAKLGTVTLTHTVVEALRQRQIRL